MFRGVGPFGGTNHVASLGWRLLGTLVVMFLALVTACNGSSGASPEEQNQEGIVEEAKVEGSPSVNRVVYVNRDGDLYTVSPDGTDPVQLTGALRAGETPRGGPLAQGLNLEEYYAWPTWAPDGAKVAASRVVLREGNLEVSVQVINVDPLTTAVIFSNDVPSLVADGAPHYLYWSPDSRYLAFLAAVERGLTLYVWDSASDGEAVPVATGAPLYFHWAVDNSMVLHVGPEIKVIGPPGSGVEQGIASESVGFRVPAFSPDGSSLAYVANSDAGSVLLVAPVDEPAAARRLVDLGPMAAFQWAPDSSALLVAERRNPGAPLFERLLLVSADGGELVELANEQLLAFFWSPTGERIAWVAVDTEERRLEWVVAPAASGEAQRLFRFNPSGGTFTMLAFFDQYGYSHSPWSPDGNSLVFAADAADIVHRRNGATPTGEQVYILDVVGGGGPRDIAAGGLAFWSWN